MTEQQTSGRDRTEEGRSPSPSTTSPPGRTDAGDLLGATSSQSSSVPGRTPCRTRSQPLGGLAYYAFLAIPALMLVAVGVFSLVADEDAVTEIIQRLEVVPQEALTLLDDTLRRVTETQSNSGLALIIVGSVLAFLDADRFDADADVGAQHGLRPGGTRGFVKQRLTCARCGCSDVARVRSGVRPARARAAPLGVDRFGGRARVFVDWLWWTAQWPC